MQIDIKELERISKILVTDMKFENENYKFSIIKEVYDDEDDYDYVFTVIHKVNNNYTEEAYLNELDIVEIAKVIRNEF